MSQLIENEKQRIFAERFSIKEKRIDSLSDSELAHFVISSKEVAIIGNILFHVEFSRLFNIVSIATSKENGSLFYLVVLKN